MRQINLLPSGCLQSNQTVVYASERKLLFTSKMALYVMNPITFSVEKIISTQARGTLSISVSPHNDNLVACSGVDGTLCVWDLVSESCERRLTHPADILAWDPHDPSNCAIIVNNPKIQLFSWLCTTKRLFVADSDTVIANVARWNPHVVGQLAIGGSNGVVYLYDAVQKRSKSLKVKDRATSVVDLQWDRLSSVYMIAAYQIFISLWDTETSTEIHVFEKQSTGISSIAWLDWTAGNFISSNVKTGVIKIWNASQKQPLESLRIHSDGISSMHFSAGSSRMICSGVDGSVLVYHMLKHQLEYCSSAGHTDTVFDCAMSPQNVNLFATCSYDTTVKIWNITDLSLKKTLQGIDGIVYSCSWSPNSKKLAASTISGNIFIFDVETSRILANYSYHEKSSYCVKWNPQAENLLLSTSADCTAVVLTLDLNQLDGTHSSQRNGAIGSRRKKTSSNAAEPISIVRFPHPKGVFGCDWCPQSPTTFATACQDGVIRIWKYEATAAITPTYTLNGHKARVFSVVWSPLIPGLLASGSDDQAILVWEVPVFSFPTETDLDQVPLTPIRRLEGHTSNVRAMSWNYEHRHLLLSGSWDATIRIWNAASGTLLQTISDHVADIYMITSHPLRPFTYISCSRDSTLRVWEFEGIQTTLRIKILISGNFEQVLPSVEEVAAAKELPPGNLLTALSNTNETMLWGEISKSLVNQFQVSSDSPRNFPLPRSIRGAELALKYRLLYDYFCGANGSVNLWDCVISYCLQQQKSDRSTDIHFNASTFSGDLHQDILKNTAIPVELILGIARSNARQLETTKSGLRRGDMSGKVEECLRLAAQKYAQTGDFLKYCSLLVEIGDWTGALAMAPCVSIEFWQKLMLDYAQHLENNLSEDCVPYYLGIGQDRAAVDFYLSRNDSSSAMIVAKMSQSRTDLIPDLTLNKTEAVKKDPIHNALAHWRGPRNESFRERTDTEDEGSNKLIRQVVLHLVERTLHQAKPISSAAYLVSIGEIESAINLLSMCGECDLAFAIADCCSLDTIEFLKQMADKAESLNKLDVCADVLSCLPQGIHQTELEFLASRHSQHEPMKKFHITDKQQSLQKAEEAQAIGHDDEAITAYLLGGDHQNAAVLGMDRLTRQINDPFQLSSMAKKILNILKNICVERLQDQTKNLFLSYIFWFGAHQAIQLGFWDVACGMLGILTTVSKTTEFPLSWELIKYHELCVRAQCCSIGTEKLLVELLQNVKSETNDSNQSEVIPILKKLRALHNDVRAKVTTNGFDPYNPEYPRSFSPTALYHQSIHGNVTAQIENEIRSISTALHLPILPSTLPDPPPGVPSVFKSSYGTSVVNSLKGIPVVVQGSILPVANQKLKIHKSFITGQIIQGPPIPLEDNCSYISINEAIMWKIVNPYSPLCTGRFLTFN